jgi:energy-coupling factor transporter ATP-binding protein EcfA2
MVGREDVFTALGNSIRFFSPKVVALVGERGSGRTSVVQSLAGVTTQTHTVFWPSSEVVPTLLNQLYCDLMGDFETPPVLSALIHTLQEELGSRSDLLPLIVIDVPYVHGPLLSEVVCGLMPVLTNLRALTVITMTPGQLAAFPEELLAEMDVTEPLAALDRGQMAELIGKRVHKASRAAWTAPGPLLDMVMEQTTGHVGRAMRLLRDLVDHSRGMPVTDQRNLELSISYYERGRTKVDDETFQRVAEAAPPILETEIEVSDFDDEPKTGDQHPDSETSDSEPSDSAPIEPSDSSGSPGSSGASGSAHSGVAVQDGASSPSTPEVEQTESLFPSLAQAAEDWGEATEADSVTPETPLDDPEEEEEDEWPDDWDEEPKTEFKPGAEGQVPPQDAEPVSERPEPEQQPEQQPEPFHEPPLPRDDAGGAEIIEMAPGTAPPRPAGGFGALIDRNRTAKMTQPSGMGQRPPNAPKTQGPHKARLQGDQPRPSRGRKVETSDPRVDLWVAEGAESPFDESVRAPDSITHATTPGTTRPSDQIPPGAGQTPKIGGGLESAGQLGDGLESAGQLGDGLESAGQLGDEIVEQATDEPEPFEPASIEVRNALSHIRRPRPIEHAPGLDILQLMSLGESEMTILEQAIEREVSPSDEHLQTELSVGRPRLSQLFNGMAKFGILTARKQGRTRLFRISAQAKDHLSNLGKGGE